MNKHLRISNVTIKILFLHTIKLNSSSFIFTMSHDYCFNQSRYSVIQFFYRNSKFQLRF